MSTSFAKKLFTKILTGIMVFTMIAPYANLANAQFIPSGTLRVTMDNAGGSFQVFNAGTISPVIARAPATGETITANVPVDRLIPEGTYDVQFGALAGFRIELETAGYTMNASGLIEDVVILSGATVNLSVNYVPDDAIPSGTLRVTMNNSEGGFNVYNAGTITPLIARAPATGETITANVPVDRLIPEGTYDVDFFEIPGFQFPPQVATPGYSINEEGTVEDVVILDGEIVSLNVNYVPVDAIPSGTLRVVMNQVASFQVFNANTLSPTIARAPAPGETITPNVPVDRLIPEGTYDVRFEALMGFHFPPTIEGYTYGLDADGKPILEDVVILDGQVTELRVTYNPDDAIPSGTLRVTLNNGDGSFEVFNAGTRTPLIARATSADVTQSVPVDRLIPEGTYDVVFGPVTNFNTPATAEDVVIVAGEITEVFGNYTAIPNTGTIMVNVRNQDGELITDGNWQVRACTGVTLDTCTIAYSNDTRSATMTSAPANRYGLIWSLSGTPYTSALVLSANPQVLTRGGTVVFNLEYSETSMRTATLNVTTRRDNLDLGSDILNPGTASVTLLVDGVATETRTPPVSLFVDVTRENTLRFNDTVPDATPPLAVTFAEEELSDGESRDIEGVYTTELAHVSVAAQLADGTPVSDIPVSIGPAESRTEFTTSAELNPVVNDVNVVDNINSILCGESQTHRFIGTNPIDITTVRGTEGSYTCLYEERDLTTISVTARLEGDPADTFQAVDVELFQGNFPEGTSVGTATTNSDGTPVVFDFIDIANSYYLVFPEIDAENYLRPINSDHPEFPGAYVLLSADLTEGVPEVVDGVYRLRNATISVTVSGLDAAETTTITLHEGADATGDVVGEPQVVGNSTVTFSIPDPSGAQFTVTCESPLPSGKVTQAGQDSETFTVSQAIIYSHTCNYVGNVAFINVQTTPVPATVTVDNLNDPDAAVPSRTSVLVPPSTYETALADRVLVAVGDALERVRVTFNPAPGLPGTTTAYQAPAAQEVNENLAPGSTRVVGPATYTETSEKEFLNLDTFGVADAAIYVDGILVRASGSDASVTVPISTTETHTVTFEARAGFIRPDPITLSAGNLEARRDQTRNILGYFVEVGQDHTFFIRSRNTTGDIYLKLNDDETLYFIGRTEEESMEGGLPFTFRVDVRNRHEFSFEDKRPEFVLQVETFCFCAEPSGLEVGGSTGITATYIPFANAAYVRFGVVNTDSRLFQPVALNVTHADSTLETFELTPTPADPDNITGTTFTEMFVVDVENETNTAVFESPLTIDAEEFTAVPQDTFVLDETNFPGGQTEGTLGSSGNPYPVTVEYVGSANLATITVRVVGADTNTVELLTTEEDGTTSSLVAGPVADGDEATFSRVRIDQAHTIRCGEETSAVPVNTPLSIAIPESTLTAGTNTFTCLYVPEATAALITVQTTAADDPDLSAPIVLNVNGTDYFMGFTIPQTDPTRPARLRFYVDADHENVTSIINFGDVAGYATPPGIDLSTVFPPLLIGSTSRVFRGTYTSETVAARITINTRLSDTLELTAAPANNIVFGGSVFGQNSLSRLIDITTLPITVNFVDNIPGYVQPLDLVLNSTNVVVGDNTFDEFYVPEASAAYISVNTVGANGEVSLNGASLGTSVAEAYLGPVLIDTARTGGNTISFGLAGAGLVNPNDIVIPEGQPGLSTNPLAPTQYTGFYLPLGETGTINVRALQSDNGNVMVNAEMRLDDRIIGYGSALDLPVGVGAHTLSFREVTGYITPLPIGFIIAAGDIFAFAGIYIPSENAFREVTIRTVDDLTPANLLNAPIQFSIDGGVSSFSLGSGIVTLNVDETVDSNQILYFDTFINPVTAETYDLVTPADGVEELTAPYSVEYLGVYHLPTFGTADLSTADDDALFTVGVAAAEISVNGALAGTQRIEGFEFESDVPTTVSWGAHPTDDTYNTPLPVYFTPISGRDYPPIVGSYTHTCEVNVEMVDADGNPVQGEVLMSIDGGPDFFYGTGVPGTGAVAINIDESKENVITINPPVLNPLGLVGDQETITIPADFLDPGLPGNCPATYTVTFAVPETDAFITIRTVDNAGVDVAGTIFLNGDLVSDVNGDVVDFAIDPLVDNTFTFGVLAGYLTPDPIAFPIGTLVAGDRVERTALYFIEARAAYIAVNTVGAEGEVSLNGESLGTSLAEAFLGPVRIDTGRAGGNTIRFGDAAGFTTPNDLVIPENQTGLSADEANSTEYTGRYLQPEISGTLNVTALLSDSGMVVPNAELRLDDLIIGYGNARDMLIPAGAHTLSFGDVEGLITPLDITFTIAAEESADFTGIYIPEGHAFREVTIRTVDDQDPANALNAPIRFSINGGVTAFSLGTGVVTLNVDETVDTNQIFYNATFTDPATAETYDLATPADGVEELTAPYSVEYLGVYHLPTFGTADLSTADDVTPFTVGVTDAEIRVNGVAVGAQRLPGVEFEAGVPATVSWGDHPTDVTYNTPQPVYFTPTAGRVYPPIVGSYTHSCDVNVVMEDADGNPIQGEVLMSIDGGPDFFFGTGEPGTGTVLITIDEERNNVITINPPMPNPLGLEADMRTITIPAGSLDPATECPATYNVTFAAPETDAFITIRTVDQDGTDVLGTIFLNGVLVSNAAGDVVDLRVDPLVDNVFTFGDLDADHITPDATPFNFPAGTLVAAERRELTAVYERIIRTATLVLQARDAANAALRIGAPISLITNGGAPVPVGVDDVTIDVDIANTYAVLWGDVADYGNPVPNPTPVVALVEGETRTITGNYTFCPTCREVVIRALNAADDTVLAAAPISVNGAAAGTGTVTLFEPEGTELTIGFDLLPGFEAPVLDFANPVTVNDDPAFNVFTARYTAIPIFVLNFDAQDNTGANLNALATLTVDGGPPEALPFALVDENPNRVFVYQAVAGLTTPAAFTIAGEAFTVPRGIRVVETSGAGVTTTFDEGDDVTLRISPFTYTITGIYAPEFVLTKTVDRALVDNNDVIRYTIRLERLSAAAGAIEVTIRDTVTATTNGGELAYIMGSTQLSGRDLAGSNCTLGALEINAAAPIRCSLDAAGDVATVIYDMRANNTTIPAGTTSRITNTASVSYVTLPAPMTATANVEIRGPAPVGPIVAVGGGGATGNGGGHIVFTGDMRLNIRKFVSLDGVNFKEALSSENAFALPEDQLSTLTVKVVIKNDSEFSATNIRFRESFERGGSDLLLQGEPLELKGARFDSKFNTIIVDKVKAGTTHEFTYTLSFKEDGTNPNVAFEKLELVHFGSGLPTVQDGLTYAGIGDALITYLKGGPVLALEPAESESTEMTDTEADSQERSARHEELLRRRLAHTGDSPVIPVMAPSEEEGRPYELARTGIASTLSILMLLVLSALGYQFYQERRYLTLKRAALQPL